MPVATVLEFPGVTRQPYDQVGASLSFSAAPGGILYHACGPIESGWRIMNISETREAFDLFVDDHYLPAMRAVGGPEPSRREVVPAYHAGPVSRTST